MRNLQENRVAFSWDFPGLERSKFIRGIDVAEGFGLVVEGHLDYLQPCVPRVDLAPARGEKCVETVEHLFSAQAENRMRLSAGLRDGKLRTFAHERRVQARNQVRRQKWRIAWGGGNERMTRFGEAALEAREGAGETADFIGDHAVAQVFVDLEILVRVDEELVNLRLQALDHPLHHRFAAEQLQALVHATHAAALAAREDHTRD